MRWRVRFYGRRIGSLGVVKEHELVIEADTPEEARLKVYEDYEHCKNFRFDPM